MWIYIYIIYVMNTEYETERKPGNTSGGPPGPGFVQTPQLLISLRWFFSQSLRPLTIRRSRSRYLLQRAGSWEKENGLWCGAPARKEGRGSVRPGELSSHDAHFSLLHFNFCPWVLRQRFAEAAGRPRERNSSLGEPSGSQSQSQPLTLLSGLGSGPSSSRQLASVSASERVSVTAPGHPLRPEPPSPGLAWGLGERDIYIYICIFNEGTWPFLGSSLSRALVPWRQAAVRGPPLDLPGPYQARMPCKEPCAHAAPAAAPWCNGCAPPPPPPPPKPPRLLMFTKGPPPAALQAGCMAEAAAEAPPPPPPPAGYAQP